MCKEKVARAAGLGDEVWEAESGSEASDHETDDESSSPQHAVLASPVARQQFMAVNNVKPLALSKAPVACPKPVARSDPTAPQGGLFGLMQHLRNDNARLREALVEAQRELEKAASRGQDSNGVDFSHLLALVKEFDDGLGGFEVEAQDTSSPHSPEVFAICSPRGDGAPDQEVAHLREELEESRREVAQLRAELAAKDAELVALRGAEVRKVLASLATPTPRAVAATWQQD